MKNFKNFISEQYILEKLKILYNTNIKISDILPTNKDGQNLNDAITNVKDGLVSTSTDNILVKQVGDKYEISDGFHRVAQHILDGKDTITADILVVNEVQIFDINNLPEELINIYDKSKKLKDPTFYCKSKDGGIYYKTTLKELFDKVISWREQGLSLDKIKNKIDTGYDVYGSKKPSKSNTIEYLLTKEYTHPSEIPKKVYDYIFSHGNLLYNDASDAVRWCRIIGTENENRMSGNITIYRAVEKEEYDEIRPGDWVTTDKQYAIEHNNRYFDGEGFIISEDVHGEDVLVSPTGNYEEAIYAPLEYSKDFSFYKK